MIGKKRNPHPQPNDTSHPVSRPKRWTKIHQILHDNHGVRYFVMALAVIIATGFILIGIMLNYKAPTLSSPPIIRTLAKPAAKIYSPLTGVEVTDQATASKPVTAIIIENSPEARPQSGLKQAGIVYEAIAEGGITRFLALYQENRPELIGPVRSVRPYYVEWAGPYDAAVAHVGGSSRALSMIRSGAYGVDLDQFFNGNSYWRVRDKAAPHNVYTSFEKLDILATAKGKTVSAFTPFARTDGKKADSPNATSISIDISTGQFHVEYAYDTATNSYKRSQGGVAHADREQGQIAPTTVIAMKVPMSIAMEDGYREQITTSGSGSATIFQNGIVTEATWSRGSDPKSALSFKDSSGKDIPLNRGQTWITALADNKGVSWQ